MLLDKASNLPPAVRFYLFTYMWSWPAWVALGLTGTPLKGVVPLVVFSFAGIGPSAVGILLARREGSGYWADFKLRVKDPRRISRSGYAWLAGFVPLTSAAAFGLYALMRGWGNASGSLTPYEGTLIGLVPFAAALMAFGPIPEELGWRGYAQDVLERTRGWFGASLVVGVGWALWHVPLFFIPGTYQNGLYATSPVLVVDFGIQFLVLALVMGWLRARERSSILSAILFHFCINFVGELIGLPPGAMVLRTAVQAVCVGAIIILSRRRNGETLICPA